MVVVPVGVIIVLSSATETTPSRTRDVTVISRPPQIKPEDKEAAEAIIFPPRRYDPPKDRVPIVPLAIEAFPPVAAKLLAARMLKVFTPPRLIMVPVPVILSKDLLSVGPPIS